MLLESIQCEQSTRLGHSTGEMLRNLVRHYCRYNVAAVSIPKLSIPPTLHPKSKCPLFVQHIAFPVMSVSHVPVEIQSRNDSRIAKANAQTLIHSCQGRNAADSMPTPTGALHRLTIDTFI